ncbi:MAG: efflux RND transporter permease subunit, partial [Verrucomicrobiae bacterium]|nr:efflux RND transporter permease subunit [Verrucomicrobiae bacterium]
MLDRLLEFSVRQRVFVLLATLALIGVGVWSALRLPMDAVPDITNIQVQINTAVPALAPEEVEKLVTFPIENEMAGVPGLTELRSLSKFGLSQVSLIFEDGTDIFRSRQLVSERLQLVGDALPPGITPKLAPISTGLGEIYYYIVEYTPDARHKPPTREAQLMELKLIHDYLIKPRLRSTPGLAEVNAIGGYEKQIVVQPDPEKLRSVGMSFDEIAEAIGENVENAGGSVIEVGGQTVTVRAAGRVRTVGEIADLPLKFGARVTPLRVRDVAEVGIGRAVRMGTATYNGEEAMLG